MESFDRAGKRDEPDPPDRRDQPADRPASPRESESELADRYGLSTLTRAEAYESLKAKADAQDADFRRRLAAEESAEASESGERGESGESGESGKSDRALTGRGDAPSAQEPPDRPKDAPERDLETPRSYWTEVSRFFTTWDRHVDRWPGKQHAESDGPGADRSYDVSPEKRAGVADEVAHVADGEPPVSDVVKIAEGENVQSGWMVGFEFRLKGSDRLMEKALEALEAQPDATPEEVVRRIPDAIRYTFCFEQRNYTAGYWDIKGRLESSGYEMYYSKNSWTDAEYKGINTRWVTPEGQRFEVQFHTPESFHAKHEVTHAAYERVRDPQTTRAERPELRAFQREVSSWIPVPERVTGIPHYKREGF